MGSYMAKAMGTYTGAISDMLETQITSAMNQIVTQITGEIGNAMQAAMGNVGTQLPVSYTHLDVYKRQQLPDRV